jgi:arabinan endo-1,5-alpha-L-arabinosidase
MSRRPLRSPSVLAAVTAALVGVAVVPTASASASSAASVTSAVRGSAPVRAAAGQRTGGFTNPVSRSFADTFADPSLIRGKDGYWYSYGTSDPLREGEGTPHRIPIARSADLVSWTHVGDAFSDATLPSWAEHDAGIWAPDIRYVDGQYRLYYVVTQTTITGERDDNAVGMATAPTPAGPWQDSGAPVVGPRRGGQVGDGNFLWTFDPTAVTDTDGSQWLFYGSYYGGLFTTKLNRNGTEAVGKPVQVAIDNKFEGSYVVHRDGYWYLFASTANCCAGPTTGYSVQVGRSRSLQGPYVDQQGARLTDSRAGGTPVLNQNGNRWVGAGHNAIATDLAGQDWIAYHAIDRADPYLDGTEGINERPMLLDRLDWVGGWPTVRAGQGPSESAERAPVTDGRFATTFSRSDSDRLSLTGGWTRARDDQSGTYLRSGRPGTVLTRSSAAGDVRAEADLRSSGAAYGLVVSDHGKDSTRLVIDPEAGTATLRQDGRGASSRTEKLPAGFDAADWHAATLERRGSTVTAQLSNARLGDPVVDLRISLPRGVARAGQAGAVAGGAAVGVDNLSVLPAAVPVTRLAAEPVPARLDRAASDEFDGSTVASRWQWVRRDALATVSGGSLRWPTEAADLTGDSNDAGLLLRNPGAGAWTAETKVSIDLGTDTVRNFQQAGLVAYVNDDLFTRLSHVAIWNTRQSEFGKEMPYAGRLSYGGTIVGPPAATTWLRLTHRLDDRTGEHLLRAWTSRDGRTWVKGGVWTLPAGSKVKVGLISHGGAGATADFDYLRIYRS